MLLPCVFSSLFVILLFLQLFPCALVHSRILRIRALLPAYAGDSFVNGPRKTNVCCAAACFSLRSLYNEWKIKTSNTLRDLILHHRSLSVHKPHKIPVTIQQTVPLYLCKKPYLPASALKTGVMNCVTKSCFRLSNKASVHSRKS